MSKNRVIGRGGRLPWHLPADLKRFKQITLNHTIIMGRKTFESIGRPLPQRRNIVVTHDRGFHATGVEIAHSLEEAIALAEQEDEVFIIGGAEIFHEALRHGATSTSRADRLFLTLIHAHIDGDVFFPELNMDEWTLIEDERRQPDEKNPLPYSFQRYERVRIGCGQGQA